MLIQGCLFHGSLWHRQLNSSVAHPCARQNEGHHHSLNFCILLSEGPVFILKSGILFSGFSSVYSFCSLSNVLLSTKFFYICLKISVEGWDLIMDTMTASHIMRLS